MRRSRWAGGFACIGFVVLAAIGRGQAQDEPSSQDVQSVCRERFANAAAKVLARKELDGAAIGIAIRSLTSGTTFWSRDAERGFAPASNLKLVTLCLALEVLGPDFEFATPLIADGPLVDGGRLEGDLWIRGSGDPTLQPCFFESEDEGAALQPFVQALTLQGVKQVRGDLVVDARAFDDERIPGGWPKDQLDQSYAAPVAALSLNGNCMRVRVTVRPGFPIGAELRPSVFGWTLDNDLVQAASRNAFNVALSPPDGRGVVRVRGSVGSDVGIAPAITTVQDPPRYFALALRSAMERSGITVQGSVRLAGDEEKLSDKVRVLYTRRSPLIPALQLCGKESDNNIAEHLLKACALVRFGKGSYANGARLVAELAQQVGVEPDSVHVVDGSGLSRDDRVTPQFLTAVLAHAYAATWRDDYVRCLPISGVDGTLDQRMNEPAMQYRVRAKTGYISKVSALSGYAMAGPGESGDAAARGNAAKRDASEVFAFSILVNGFKGANAEMKRVQDDLCRALIAAARQ